MKKIFTILAIALFTVTAGAAYAYDLWNTGTEDKFYGEISAVPMTVVPGALGTAAGGIRESAIIKDEDKGSRIFDTMFGAQQEVLFDSYTVTPGLAVGSHGKAAGGVRADADKGSRIFEEMFGARQAVLFE